MNLSIDDLKQVDHHWAVEALEDGVRSRALQFADNQLVSTSLRTILNSNTGQSFDPSVVERVATAYELAAIEGLEAILYPSSSPESKTLEAQARAGAFRAFGLRRVLEISSDVETRIFEILHLAGLAYCGDRWTDLRRWFKEHQDLCEVSTEDESKWDKRLLYRLFDAWIRLLRKDAWADLSHISQIILDLRADQKRFEAEYLSSVPQTSGRSIAFTLVALYHWAKATERLAEYMLQGEPVNLATELNQHYEAALKAAQAAQDYQFETVLRWLHVASRKMVSNSIWSVVASVNSRVTKFVQSATKTKGLFELLPPQRVALQEQGLLDQANRAVVVEMPTSGGKTALAQFRILQALNQFDQVNGWVAYVAPTRALVSQITRRLRTDFSPLGVNIEQLTGAIEIDAFESTLLGEQNAFDVLVATPEKLQLVIRNKRVDRPLALVVMDEAHNIEDESRGLRIELLLATIKQESPRANFLLLMPNVPNAADLAQWLGGDASKTISLGSTAWQPNERIVGLFDIKPYAKKGSKSGDWLLSYKTLTTTHRSINLHGEYRVGSVRPVKNLSFSQARGVNVLAGSMAKVFCERGTSIAVAGRIADAWHVARKIGKDMPSLANITKEIALVQRFLATEIGEDFELIELLSKGIAVHHAGLPAEVLALIEWLTELGQVKVMCATTTIAQGLNFPVSSVLLATYKFPYGNKMTHRAFWNLAGRAGRVQHDSVGVVGIAAGANGAEVSQYVSDATGSLISRLVKMLDSLEQQGQLNNLQLVIQSEQWDDFRSYIAHLWNEKRNLDAVLNEAEQFLRHTYGYSSLRSKKDESSRKKADLVLEATKFYVRQLSEHPENALLADATGFSPEGVRTALLELNNLENKLTQADWEPTSLFGDKQKSVLPQLVGVMLKIPQLKNGLDEIKGEGLSFKTIADVTQAWVSGKSLREIAIQYFNGKTDTDKISKACKAIYRNLTNNAAWGLSALSKMPTAGLNFEALSEDDLRRINNLPAMLYHGVRSEEAVLMRMNSVPRSIAENLATEFKGKRGSELSPSSANDFLRSLDRNDWQRLRPKSSTMTGEDYQNVWKRLSGYS